MAAATCQICLDTVDSSQLVVNVCGKSCTAMICRHCLGRHVEVTLQKFYLGILPRICCPICLVAMHASCWEGRVPVDARTTLRANPQTFGSDRSAVENFKKLCKKFCRHKLEPRVVLDYAFSTFGEEKAMVVMNELAIPRIQDPERRATLLLSLMYFRPNTKTHCCGYNFCFNCKRLGQHASCAEEFDQDNDLTLRREQRKGLVPVDIFDLALTDFWLAFRYKQSNVNKLIWLHKQVLAVRRLLRPVFAEYVWRFRFSKILTTLRPAWVAKRTRYVDQTTASLRGILLPALSSFIWRQRFTRTMPSMESEPFWKVYYRWHPSDLDTEAEEMNAILNIGVYDEE